MNFQDVIALGCFLLVAITFGREIRYWSKNRYPVSSYGGVIPGMALMGIVFHGLGAIGILHRSMLVLLPSIMLFRQFISSGYKGNSLAWLRTMRFRFTFHKSPSNWILLAFCFVVLKPIFVLSIRSADAYDALAYQMHAPLRAMFQTHLFNSNDLIANAGLPVGAGSLHGWLVAFGLNPLSGFVNFLFSLLLILAIISKKDKLHINLMKISAVFGMIYALGSAVYGSVNSDLALTVFLVAALYQIERDSNRQIHLETVLILAFIPLIKPFAIVFSFAIIVSAGINQGKSKSWVAKMCTCVALPYLLWCLKNLVQVRNPFFPMFQNLFGGPGYGEEAMTLESDVRRSFSQFAEVIQRFFTNPLDTLMMYSNWLILPCLVVALLINQGVNKNRLLSIGNNAAAWLSITIGVLFAGPVGRYALYGLVALTLYSVLAYGSTLGDRSLTRKQRVMVNFSTGLLIIVPLSLGFPNFVNASINSNHQPQMDTDVANVQSVAVNLIPNRSTICTVGDGRGLLFYPQLVHSFENNRKNPFAEINGNDHQSISKELKSAGCEYLIIHWGWGFPGNIDVKSMKTWTQKQEIDGFQLFNSQNWQVYQLN